VDNENVVAMFGAEAKASFLKKNKKNKAAAQVTDHQSLMQL
jgi:hypothetical protein